MLRQLKPRLRRTGRHVRGRAALFTHSRHHHHYHHHHHHHPPSSSAIIIRHHHHHHPSCLFTHSRLVLDGALFGEPAGAAFGIQDVGPRLACEQMEGRGRSRKGMGGHRRPHGRSAHGLLAGEHRRKERVVIADAEGMRDAPAEGQGGSVEGNRRAWKGMVGHGRAWTGMEGHGRA